MENNEAALDYVTRSISHREINVYNEGLLQIQKEDIFNSAPKFFYDEKKIIRLVAIKSDYLEFKKTNL